MADCTYGFQWSSAGSLQPSGFRENPTNFWCRLHNETTPEKFTEIVQRATNMADGHKLYGLVQKITKAFTVKLSAHSLNLVGTIMLFQGTASSMRKKCV